MVTKFNGLIDLTSRHHGASSAPIQLLVDALMSYSQVRENFLHLGIISFSKLNDVVKQIHSSSKWMRQMFIDLDNKTILPWVEVEFDYALNNLIDEVESITVNTLEISLGDDWFFLPEGEDLSIIFYLAKTNKLTKYHPKQSAVRSYLLRSV